MTKPHGPLCRPVRRLIRRWRVAQGRGLPGHGKSVGGVHATLGQPAPAVAPASDDTAYAFGGLGRADEKTGVVGARQPGMRGNQVAQSVRRRVGSRDAGEGGARSAPAYWPGLTGEPRALRRVAAPQSVQGVVAMLSVAWRAGRDGRPSSRVGGLVSTRTGVGPTTAEVVEQRRLPLRQWPRLRDERTGRSRISAMPQEPWQSARPLANLAASRADGAGTSSKAGVAVPAGSGTGCHDTEPRESDSRWGPWRGRRPDLVGEALGERECPWLPLGRPGGHAHWLGVPSAGVAWAR